MDSWQAEVRVIIRPPVKRIFETLRDYNNFGNIFGLEMIKKEHL